MKKLFLLFLLGVSACEVGGPSVNVDFSLLPGNEISIYIIKVYPNNPTNFKLIIKQKLNNDYSEKNIKHTVSEMGMACHENICSYRGVVKQSVVIDGEKKNGVFNFYMEIDVKKGIDSFVSKRF